MNRRLAAHRAHHAKVKVSTKRDANLGRSPPHTPPLPAPVRPLQRPQRPSSKPQVCRRALPPLPSPPLGLTVAFAGEQLGRDVVGGAHKLGLGLAAPEKAAQPKVGQLDDGVVAGFARGRERGEGSGPWGARSTGWIIWRGARGTAPPPVRIGRPPPRSSVDAHPRDEKRKLSGLMSRCSTPIWREWWGRARQHASGPLGRRAEGAHRTQPDDGPLRAPGGSAAPT